MNRWIVAPVLALGLTGLAACGGSSSGGSNTVPADADVTVRAIDGIKWNSDAYTATSDNGEVTIYGVNNSSIAHNLHVTGPDGKDTIGDVIDLPSSGSDGTVTIKLEPGEYRIICFIPGHSATMNSSLTVS